MNLQKLLNLGCLFLIVQCVSAKEFVNLNFDQGGRPAPPFDLFQPADFILPGWTARMGDHVLTEIVLNNGFQDNGLVGVYSAGGPWGPLPQGLYGMRLTAGPEFPSSGPIVTASISQSGTIPDFARSLLFDGLIGGGSVTELRIDGTVMPLHLLIDSPERPVYGVDLTGLSGRDVELSFINYAAPDRSTGGAVIDTLRFTTSIVPEPATWTLLCFGGVLILLGVRPRRLIH